MKFRTKLIEFDKKNRNGRIYSKENFDDFDTTSKFLYGEFNYGNPSSNANIVRNKSSHITENIKMTDDGIYGDIRILDTLNGNIVKDIIDSGQKLGVASRGLGTIDENGIISNYKLLTFDLVTESASDIYIDSYTEKKNINDYVKKIDNLKEEWTNLKLISG